jgi:hypothetical protein
MNKEHREFRPFSRQDPLVITDAYLIRIVQAIENLLPLWRRPLEDGLVRLDFAVEIGSKLPPERQEHLFEFLRDHPVPQKHESKVLLAFSFDMPEWVVLEVLRLYKQADKIREAIVMYNDLMDRYEEIFYEEFEYRFLDNELPKDEDALADTLADYQKRLQALYEQTPRFHNKKAYGRMYSDSSSSSQRIPAKEPINDKELYQLLGVREDASSEEVKKQYRYLMKVLHPDSGGSAYLFDMVKKAYEAEKE